MKKIIYLLLSTIILLVTLGGCTSSDPIEDSIYVRDIYTWNGTGWQLVGSSLLYSGNETDPVFLVSPAGTITLADINAWDGHPALTTGTHGVTGTIVGTSDAQELTNKTLTSAIANGVWTTLGVWTLPAITLGGDVTSDRWLNQDTNTFYGLNVVGADNLVHIAGSSGWQNTAVGYSALYSDNIGYANTAIGSHAMQYVTEGNSNTAIGAFSMYNTVDGNYNTAIGNDSLMRNIDGNFNTAIGIQASGNNTSGSYNTAIGIYAGFLNNTGDNNVFIGYKAGYNETGSDKLYIDSTNTTAPLIYGDFSTNELTVNGKLKVTVNLNINGLPIYANNAAAIAGGLIAGDLYRTGGDPDLLCVVH